MVFISRENSQTCKWEYALPTAKKLFVAAAAKLSNWVNLPALATPAQTETESFLV